MRYIIVFLFFALASCETSKFDRDKRQIIAKDQIGRQLRGNRNFSITAFKEDTLQAWPDTMITHPIRYTLDFFYYDSLGALQSKKGITIFTREGNAILNTSIINQLNSEK